SESVFSTSGRVLSIQRTRLTPASLEMCMCLKDHLDAQERKQDKSTLEAPTDFEEEILDVEVQANEVIPLSDEEIAPAKNQHKIPTITKSKRSFGDTAAPDGPRKPSRERSILENIFKTLDRAIVRFLDPPFHLSVDPSHILAANFAPVNEINPTEWFCKGDDDDGEMKELHEAFELYDLNKNGLISSTKLHQILTRLGMSVSIADGMIKSVD
ncbi:zinc finger BED domain-containing protein RICESLEEPER 2, partial [Tanacetum coccineum]